MFTKYQNLWDFIRQSITKENNLPSLTRREFGETLFKATSLLLLPVSSVAEAEEIDTEFDVVVQQDVMVVMRDGVRLATDIYYPARDGKPVAQKFPSFSNARPITKLRSAARKSRQRTTSPKVARRWLHSSYAAGTSLFTKTAAAAINRKAHSSNT